MIRTQTVDELEDGILQDGQVLRVPLLLMDAAAPPDVTTITRRALADTRMLHKPGSLALTDAAVAGREAAIAARNKRLSDGWRSPPAAPVVKSDSSAIIPAKDVASAIANRNRRLEGAWRGGAA